MKLDIYYVDAFSHKLLKELCCVIFSNLNDDNLMQNIAAENNLSETALLMLQK